MLLKALVKDEITLNPHSMAIDPMASGLEASCDAVIDIRIIVNIDNMTVYPSFLSACAAVLGFIILRFTKARATEVKM